jgi:Ca-activated chloride channel family protein
MQKRLGEPFGGAAMLKLDLRGLSVVLYLVAIMLSGCGGGGDSDTVPRTPVLQSSTADYSFGDVTLDNFPAAKVITLSNSGNAPLTISDIELIELGGAGFTLDLNSGANFCGSTPLTLAAGGSCTIAVDFGPTATTGYSATLSVSSDDPGTPMDFSFTGTGVTVTVPTLQINRVEADDCASSERSIYLSVTDQLGYPIVGLTDFTVSETSIPMLITTQDSISTSHSVALVMDYSGSITDHPEVQAAMEAGVIRFIKGLGDNDEAEIVKFDSEIDVVQSFTPGNAAGKELLIAKVIKPWDMGRSTRFNDAIYQAVGDLASSSKDRKILVLVSDGFDFINPGDTLSTYGYAETRDYAVETGVNVFPVGIADQLSELNVGDLELLASVTGGQYFDTLVADDLNTIYQQLAQILFVDQYLLTYNSGLNPGDSALLRVEVTLIGGSLGEDSLDIVPCPLPPP